MQFYVVRHPGVSMLNTRVSVCMRPGCRTSYYYSILHSSLL